MYYDKGQLLSYNRLFSVVMGERGNGKSFAFKEWAIKDFKKNGKQAVILRRYKDEIKEFAPKYFNDMQKFFPDDEFKTDSKHIYINGQIAGFFIPLSIGLKYKSSSFENVNKIIYEEFIIDKKSGVMRYLPNEVDVYYEMFETIARMRNDVRGIFVANSVSVVNPYFLAWNITPSRGKRFTVKDHLVLELTDTPEYRKAKKETKFGQFIDGTNYGKYAIDNEFLRDNDTFIQPKSPNAKFSLAMTYKGITYGFWIDYQEGLIFVNRQWDPSTYNHYAISKDDHAPNMLLIKGLIGCKPIKRIIEGFQYGYVRFSDMQVKNQFYEYISFFLK